MVLQVQELGIQAEFEDPLEEDEDDIDDLLEETEDPWMREPAGASSSSQRHESQKGCQHAHRA